MIAIRFKVSKVCGPGSNVVSSFTKAPDRMSRCGLFGSGTYLGFFKHACGVNDVWRECGYIGDGESVGEDEK